MVTIFTFHCFEPTSKGCDIGVEEASALAEALKQNNALRTLDLRSKRFSLLPPHQHQGNNIGPSGASALAEALKQNSTLTTLYLYSKYFPLMSSHHHQDNNIGPSGASAVAEALKQNNALTTLWLSSKYSPFCPLTNKITTLGLQEQVRWQRLFNKTMHSHILIFMVRKFFHFCPLTKYQVNNIDDDTLLKLKTSWRNRSKKLHM
jgi:hypothetical protein